MKFRFLLFVLISAGPHNFLWGREGAALTVTSAASHQIIAVIDHGVHLRYGCVYPLTYQIDFPPAVTGLIALHRKSQADAWTALPEKQSSDRFNAIEAVRFDYATNRAYISASFFGTGDSLFLQITDGSGTPLPVTYGGISTYYDNRRSVVTVTADDWGDWTMDWYLSLLTLFRSRGLYVSAGLMSGPEYLSSPSWQVIQKELDSGYLEMAAHSRSHPYTPYADPYGEVAGCYDDIVNNLTLPPLSRVNGTGYVYVWLAPYGDYDATVDSLLSVRGYLVPRLVQTGGSAFSAWDESRKHFAPITLTLELGAPSWGGGTTDPATLNASFDAVAGQGGIFHMMWHPQVIYPDRDQTYLLTFLNYISGRRSVRYVNLGHLYLYHLLQQSADVAIAEVPSDRPLPDKIELYQNFPNPFNPTTTIRYALPQKEYVSLTVFTVVGQRVATLVNREQEAGVHEAHFDGGGLASGVYFFRLDARSMEGGGGVTHVETKRLMLLR